MRSETVSKILRKHALCDWLSTEVRCRCFTKQFQRSRVVDGEQDTSANPVNLIMFCDTSAGNAFSLSDFVSDVQNLSPTQYPFSFPAFANHDYIEETTYHLCDDSNRFVRYRCVPHRLLTRLDCLCIRDIVFSLRYFPEHRNTKPVQVCGSMNLVQDGIDLKRCIEMFHEE